jgi:recombinational DNA repair protein RecT
MEQQQESKLQLTTQLITSQKGAKEIVELPQVRENWISTLALVSGKSNEQAALLFEAEKIMFMQIITGSYQLQKADKFSIYQAWTMLAASGGTLRDGICYILPYGNKAVYQPGYKFRLEQINEMPNVVHCHEPQVVYDCDEFDYEKGMKTIIRKHKPGVRKADSKITHVYFVIDFNGFADAYIMDAVDVLKIRDQYSISYKSYVADCVKAGKEIGSTFKVQKSGQNGPYETTVEPPMWIKDEAQAFKKTLVKRTWNALPKLPKQKWLEERVKAQNIPAGLDAEELKDAANNEELVDTLEKTILKEPEQPTPSQGATPDNSRNTITDLESEEVGADNPEAGF